DASEVVERVGDTTLLADRAEQGQAFGVELGGAGEVSLLAGGDTEVVEDVRDAERVAELTVQGQPLLVMPRRADVVAPVTRKESEHVEGLGAAGPVLKLAPDRQTPLEVSGGVVEVSLLACENPRRQQRLRAPRRDQPVRA